MIQKTLIALAVAFFTKTCLAQIPEGAPAFIPLPHKLTTRPEILPLKDGLRIAVGDPSLSPLARTLAAEVQAIAGIKPVTIPDGEGDVLLTLDPALEEELYRLEIDDRVILTGGSFQALANATSTFLQALVLDESGAPGISKVTVEDGPDTAYRGLMLDVARQWHSPEIIKEVIQLCRFYKIRYLQLHLTDDQAWTMPLKKFPGVPTPNRSYTIGQIKDLVSFADQRGVTLIPEIDMPAHCSAICKAMPELFKSPNGGIINFASEDTVKAMEQIVDEVAALFHSSPYFHLGADEANLSGLDRDPGFQAAIKRHGVKGIGGLFNHFLNRINARVLAHGKTSIVWEGFHLGEGANALDQSIIVMPFDNYRNAETYYIKGGHRLINTSWYPLYVVGQRPLTRFLYDWDLHTFGNFTDPFPRRTTSVRQYEVTEKEKVLGAQLCSWEQSGESEMRQLREPLPAMAERIWNHKATDYDDFRKRLSRTDQLLNALLTRSLPSPVDATASNSVYPDGVMVRWKAGDNYSARYTVLRSEEETPDSAKPIASGITALEYFDQSAESGKRYFYWVKAINKLGDSKPGKSAPGSTGSSTEITKVYEGFDYPEGASLAGQTGGTGWETPWTFQTEGPVVIKKAGLTYEGLPTSGGCVNVKMRMRTPDEKSLHIVRNTEVPMGEPGTDFWMSFLMRANKLGEGHSFFKNTGKAWVNGLGVHTRNSGHALKEGETVLLVARYSCLEGQDIIRMWVNPELGKTPPSDSQDMAFCEAVDIGISPKVVLNVQPHGNGDYDFDELRIGRTWTEVIGRK